VTILKRITICIMNLQVNNFYFFALATFLFFSACKSKKNLGQEFVPNSEKTAVYTDSVFLECSTIKVDTNYTSSSYISSFLIGNLENDNVIQNDVTTYTKLNYAETTIDASAELVNMKMTIYGIGTVYGDTTNTFNLKVFQTKTAVDTSYKYAHQSIDLEDEAIVDTSFKPGAIRGDTLTMTFDNTFANKVLETIKNSSTKTVTEFDAAMKGIAFKGYGKNVISVPYSNFSIYLFYKVGKDTSSIELSPFRNSTLSHYFVGMKNTMLGNLAGMQNRDSVKSTSNSGKVYSQYFSKLMVKTKIPKLTNIGTNETDLLINRAEIILKAPEVLNNLANNYVYAPKFYIFYATPDRRELKYGSYYNMLTSFAYTNSAIYSYYNESDETYRLDVTDYIQKYMDENINISDLIFYSEHFGLITLGDASQNPNNFKLKVHYTKLNN
jgi:hypothetical protein